VFWIKCRVWGFGFHNLVPLVSALGIFAGDVHERAAAAPQPQDMMQHGAGLDVVIEEGAPVLQLLPVEDETLLVDGDAFQILDHLL